MFYSVAETNSARVWQSFIMASPFFCSEETGQLWLTRKGKRLNKLPVKYGVGNILRAFSPHFATEVMSLRGWTSRMLWRRCSETLLFTMVWLEVCVKQSRLWTSTSNMGALNEPRPHPFCWLLSCWAYNAYAGARLSYVFWQRIAPKPVTSGWLRHSAMNIRSNFWRYIHAHNHVLYNMISPSWVCSAGDDTRAPSTDPAR